MNRYKWIPGRHLVPLLISSFVPLSLLDHMLNVSLAEMVPVVMIVILFYFSVCLFIAEALKMPLASWNYITQKQIHWTVCPMDIMIIIHTEEKGIWFTVLNTILWLCIFSVKRQRMVKKSWTLLSRFAVGRNMRITILKLWCVFGTCKEIDTNRSQDSHCGRRDIQLWNEVQNDVTL